MTHVKAFQAAMDENYCHRDHSGPCDDACYRDTLSHQIGAYIKTATPQVTHVQGARHGRMVMRQPPIQTYRMPNFMVQSDSADRLSVESRRAGGTDRLLTGMVENVMTVNNAYLALTPETDDLGFVPEPRSAEYIRERYGPLPGESNMGTTTEICPDGTYQTQNYFHGCNRGGWTSGLPSAESISRSRDQGLYLLIDGGTTKEWRWATEMR